MTARRGRPSSPAASSPCTPSPGARGGGGKAVPAGALSSLFASLPCSRAADVGVPPPPPAPAPSLQARAAAAHVQSGASAAAAPGAAAAARRRRAGGAPAPRSGSLSRGGGGGWSRLSLPSAAQVRAARARGWEHRGLRGTAAGRARWGWGRRGPALRPPPLPPAAAGGAAGRVPPCPRPRHRRRGD